jgi:uroporphyrinogen decarboxylase
VRRYGSQRGDFYSDIVGPLLAIGLGLDIKPGVGPIVAEPIRSAGDLARLRPLESDDVPV